MDLTLNIVMLGELYRHIHFNENNISKFHSAEADSEEAPDDGKTADIQHNGSSEHFAAECDAFFTKFIVIFIYYLIINMYFFLLSNSVPQA